MNHDEKIKNFEKELSELMNKYNLENESDTPGFLLAQYLIKILNITHLFMNKEDKLMNYVYNNENLDNNKELFVKIMSDSVADINQVLTDLFFERIKWWNYEIKHVKENS